MSERVQQVNQLIKYEVSNYLQSHLGGHAGVLTITAVETSSDLKSSTIWYGYVGEDQQKATVELRKVKRELQQYINKRLTMKSVPRISFKLDKSGDYATHISKIIDRATHETTRDS
jgi:ribosome-binding factor A